VSKFRFLINSSGKVVPWGRALFRMLKRSPHQDNRQMRSR